MHMIMNHMSLFQIILYSRLSEMCFIQVYWKIVKFAIFWSIKFCLIQSGRILLKMLLTKQKIINLTNPSSDSLLYRM